jgi:hypothetical protein
MAAFTRALCSAMNASSDAASDRDVVTVTVIPPLCHVCVSIRVLISIRPNTAP